MFKFVGATFGFGVCITQSFNPLIAGTLVSGLDRRSRCTSKCSAKSSIKQSLQRGRKEFTLSPDTMSHKFYLRRLEGTFKPKQEEKLRQLA